MFSIRVALSSSARIRAAAAASPTQKAGRFFHASPAAHKAVKEKASEVNKKLGKGLAAAIDQGEKATYAAKDSIESAAGTAQEKAKETETVVKQKGNQAAAGAGETKEDIEKKL